MMRTIPPSAPVLRFVGRRSEMNPADEHSDGRLHPPRAVASIGTWSSLSLSHHCTIARVGVPLGRVFDCSQHVFGFRHARPHLRVFRVHEMLFDHLVQERVQRLPVIQRVEQDNGIEVEAQSFSVIASNNSSSVPQPPGSATTASEPVSRRCLRSRMSSTISRCVRPGWPHSRSAMKRGRMPMTSPPFHSAPSPTAPIEPAEPPPYKMLWPSTVSNSPRWNAVSR